jgi:hypothetical protein
VHPLGMGLPGGTNWYRATACSSSGYVWWDLWL